VRSIVWSPDDARLVSAGADGAVYEWALAGFKRERESVIKARARMPPVHRWQAAAVRAACPGARRPADLPLA
jgi:WD40 repeat protein